MSSSHSPIHELDKLIQEINPFESGFVTKSHHIWDEQAIDAKSLHSEVFEEITDIIYKINTNRLPAKAVGLAILAPKGTGKSHVLGRVRRYLKTNGGGLFIYASEYGDLNRVRYQFLQTLASSLKKSGQYDVMQWQELAAYLFNQSLNKKFTPKQLLKGVPNLLAKNKNFITLVANKVHATFPDIDNPYLIRAIIWTLSPPHCNFAINWLAGRDLSEVQIKIMDLPNSAKEDKAAEAFNTTQQILELIGKYTTPVICFDQLDGTEHGDGMDLTTSGLNRAQVVASFASDLFNNLRRGVILTTMLKKTYQDHFFSRLPTISAVKDRIAQKELELNLLKSNDVIALVSSWLTDFYARNDLIPPDAIYPFQESQLREVGKEGPRVRDVLQWCAQNFGPIDKVKWLQRIYHELQNELEDFIDDDDLITDALIFSLRRLKGETVEKVTVQEVTKEVTPKSAHKGRIQFCIIGAENQKPVRIGVSVLQNSNAHYVGATLKYLTWYEKFRLTRGCLIRSYSIDEKWKVANQYLNLLLNEQGGEWANLKPDEIKPLLALHQMSKQLDWETLSEEEFNHFINEKCSLKENPLIKEILSDPSGEKPTAVIDEDAELEDAFSEFSDLNLESLARGTTLESKVDALDDFFTEFE